MKVGFTTENEETTEPVTGSAEITDEEEENDWFEFLFPKMLNFFMVYGALSLIKDVANYVLKRK